MPMDYNEAVIAAQNDGLNNNAIAARYFITVQQVEKILNGETPIKAAGKKKTAADVELC